MSSSHPGNVLPANRALDLVCPACRGELEATDNAYRCPECRKEFPVRHGIPDFRMFPDPYLSVEDDSERADMVVSLLPDHSLESLLERYWSVSEVTPPDLRRRFIRSALLSAGRSERYIELLQEHGLEETLLDAGSGTGGLLVAAAKLGCHVVGVDIAMRWLHVSRRRFMDARLECPPLVCACSEALPFRGGTFDRVSSVSTLEFARDAGAAIGEASRVLKDDGTCLVATVNRYSLSYDPYAYLRFVGFLPRWLQPRYVSWRRQAQWKIQELSLPELDGLAAHVFRSREYELPDLDDESLKEFSFAIQRQARMYRRVKNLAGMRFLLKRFGPGWEAILKDPIRPNVRH